MKTYKECLLCFDRQAADACDMAMLNMKATETVVNAVRAKIKSFEHDNPPIKMAIEIHDLIRSESGIADPYADIKNISNDACKETPFILSMFDDMFF